jgi:hypothetical protein
VAAEPIPDVPEDPEDPRVILRDLPERERERECWLAQYREALEAARDPAGYGRLRMILRLGHLMTIACNRPGYYEAIEAARSGSDPGE